MRNRVFTIRLSEDEHRKMRELAKEFHMKPSELIRAFIHGDIVSEMDEKKMERAVKKSLRSFV